MKFAVLLLLSAAGVYAQGYTPWTELPNTKLRSVCPPNNYGVGAMGYPSYDWSIGCVSMIAAYNSAAVDTKRNRMCVWGSGHFGYRGNEVYCIDFSAPSSSTADCGDHGPCITSSNGSSVPTITRVNNPSIDTQLVNGTCGSPDGKPRNQHTWGAFIYLPKHDAFFTTLGYDQCGVPDKHIWLLHAGTMTWEDKGDLTASISPGYGSSEGAWAVLDPSSPSDKEYVLFLAGRADLIRYDPDANTVARVKFGPSGTTGGYYAPLGPSIVIDPDRKQLFAFGSTTYAPDAGGKIFMTDLSNGAPNGGALTATDITSQTTGCDALKGYDGPGLEWDESIGKLVGYVPRTLASANPYNAIIVFDPATYTCVQSAGSGAAPPNGPAAYWALRDSNASHVEIGIYGHFRKVPGIGKYVLINNVDENVWTFALNASDTPGLGSSTLTCVDRDGDGYGTGAGCSGQDADDLDSAVHSSAQFLSRWGTMIAGLNHLGYNPNHIWYLSPTGTNASTASVPNCKDADVPCATFAYISALVACGDAVLLHGGATYTERMEFSGDTWKACTSGNPIIIRDYPGEQPLFSALHSGLHMRNTSYAVVEGLKFAANEPSQGAIVDLGSWIPDFDSAHNLVFRRLEVSGNFQGLQPETTRDVIVEDSSFHDQNSDGQHGIYFANHDGLYNVGATGVSARYSTNIFVRRTLLYNNPWSGLHMNGRHSNAVVKYAVAWQNGTASDPGKGFNFENGVRASRFLNLVALNNGIAMSFDAYGIGQNSWCDVYDPGNSVCPYPMNNNLVDGLTFYSAGKDQTGVDYGSQRGIQMEYVPVTAGNPPTDWGNNTFRNITGVVNHDLGGGYSPIHFSQAVMASTTTVSSVRFYNSRTSTPNQVFDVFFNGTGNYYSCAGASAILGSLSGCTYGDPGFVAASNSYYSSPASFNLRPASGSPLILAGAPSPASFDLLGSLRNPSVPTIGAYEDSTPPLPCVINTTNLPGATVGTPYVQTLSKSNCGVDVWSGWSGCGGLTLNSVTGVLQGTPSSAQTCTQTVTYSTASRALSVVISAATAPSPGSTAYSGTFGGIIK